MSRVSWLAVAKLTAALCIFCSSLLGAAAGGPILDISERVALEDLVYRYASLVDARDFQKLPSLFTKDAKLEYKVTLAGFPIGHVGDVQATMEWLKGGLGMHTRSSHLMGNIMAESHSATNGRYEMNAVKDAQGVWRFAEFRNESWLLYLVLTLEQVVFLILVTLWRTCKSSPSTRSTSKQKAQ